MSMEHLSDQQIARVEALQSAALVLGRKSGGPFGPTTPPDVMALMDLADYIIGTQEKERYRDADPVHDA